MKVAATIDTLTFETEPGLCFGDVFKKYKMDGREYIDPPLDPHDDPVLHLLQQQGNGEEMDSSFMAEVSKLEFVAEPGVFDFATLSYDSSPEDGRHRGTPNKRRRPNSEPSLKTSTESTRALDGELGVLPSVPLQTDFVRYVEALPSAPKEEYRKAKPREKWSNLEMYRLWNAVSIYGNNWTAVSKHVHTRNYFQIKDKGRRELCSRGWETGRNKEDGENARKQAQIIGTRERDALAPVVEQSVGGHEAILNHVYRKGGSQ